jgi:3-keto-5-aminohexanoate cleavage enzyme
MAFEARKVVSNLREPGVPSSAARALTEPAVVCRAEGTCVVPKELQRRPLLNPPAFPAVGEGEHVRGSLTEGRVIVPPAPHFVVTPARETPPEVVLTAAIVGAEITRAQTPHLPITAQEIADEAARCREVGAAIIHLHVRNADGTPTQSAELYGEAIAAIRAKTDVIIQTSTGGAVGMSLHERSQPLLLGPEMASLNCGTLNFGDDIFVNTRPQIRDLARRIAVARSIPELECYDVGHIDEALALAEEGLVPRPLHFQFVLGVPGGIGAREDVMRFMASQVPPGSTWGVAAVGRAQRPMTELAMRIGGHARVGIEDNIYWSKGVLAEGSAPLVARAADFARSIGRAPVTPERARELFGIRLLAGR